MVSYSIWDCSYTLPVNFTRYKSNREVLEVDKVEIIPPVVLTDERRRDVSYSKGGVGRNSIGID